MPASRDLPTSLEPTSLTAGEAGDFMCLRDPPQAPCLRRPGLFSFGLHATGYNAIQRLPGSPRLTFQNRIPRPTLGTTVSAPLSFAPVFLGLALHGRCIVVQFSVGPAAQGRERVMHLSTVRRAATSWQR